MPPYYAAGPAYPPGYAPPPPGFPVPPAYPAPVGAYPPANGYPSPIAPGEESEESSSEGFDDSRSSARRTRKREPAGIPSWVFAVVGGVFLLILIAVGVLVMGGKESSTKPTEPSRYQPVPKSKEKDKEKTKGGKTKPTEPD